MVVAATPPAERGAAPGGAAGPRLAAMAAGVAELRGLQAETHAAVERALELLQQQQQRGLQQPG
eukprot:gene4355-18917_t